MASKDGAGVEEDLHDEIDDPMILATTQSQDDAPWYQEEEEEEEEENEAKIVAKLLSLNPKFEDIPIHCLARGEALTIGRSNRMSVTLKDPRISSHHCDIVFIGNMFWLRDCSTNGTWIQKKRVTGKCQIRHGDILYLIFPRARNKTLLQCTECLAYLFQDLRRMRDDLFVKRLKLSAVYTHYAVIKEIGRGSFGSVWRVLRRSTKTMCAMKVVDKIKLSGMNAQQTNSKIFDEVKLLSKLSHPNIVDIYDCFETHRYVTMALELAKGGDLSELLRRNPGRMPEKVARCYFQQILAALQYMHSKNIAHRDLKPENVLLMERISDIRNELPILKLSDFGLAKIAGSTLMTTFCGTPYYVAPEILQQDRRYASLVGVSTGYSNSVDLWSAGVMLFELLCGVRPFEVTSRRPAPLLKQIAQAVHVDFRLIFPSGLSRAACDLLNGLVRPAKGNIGRRSARMTASECLAHEWMSSEKRARETTAVDTKDGSTSAGRSTKKARRELKRSRTRIYH